MTRPRPDESKPSKTASDRGQIVLVAAAVVAVALLSMTLAYAHLSYDADRTGAGTVTVASVSEIDRSLTGSLRAAAREVRRADDAQAWPDRRRVADRVGASLAADSDRLERLHAEESRSLTIDLDGAAATRWARQWCPDGPGREFGPCRAIDGVVVQERADETVVVAAAFRIRIVSPAESTTVTTVARVVSPSGAGSLSREPPRRAAVGFGSGAPEFHTVGYNYVKIFDTPGCRNPSRDDSRQYQLGPPELRQTETD